MNVKFSCYVRVPVLKLNLNYLFVKGLKFHGRNLKCLSRQISL